MFDFAKKNNEQKEQIDRLSLKCEMLESIMHGYLAWVFGYRNSIVAAVEKGVLTRSQADDLFVEARKHYEEFIKDNS